VCVIAASAAGASSQRPCSGVPSSAAKQAPESKRGQHSQSTEPSFAISAAVWPSDEGVVFDQGGHGQAILGFEFTMRTAAPGLHVPALRPVYSAGRRSA